MVVAGAAGTGDWVRTPPRPSPHGAPAEASGYPVERSDHGMKPRSHRPVANAACSFYHETLGFVPNLVLAQAELPRLIEADLLLSRALHRDGALTGAQKELLQFVVAVGNECVYEATLRRHTLHKLGMLEPQLDRIVLDYRRADLSESDVNLLDFALRLAGHPTWISPEDIDQLRSCGFDGRHIMEATFAVAWANYRCVMATGLRVNPDFAAEPIPPAMTRETRFRPPERRTGGDSARRPYVIGPPLPAESFAPFAEIEALYGFIPNVYFSQTERPDVVEAEIRAADIILHPDDVLSRDQKEYIFLAVSAANLNTYCVAIHCEVLRGMGRSDKDLEQIAVDHHHSDLCAADRALLDYCLTMSRRREQFTGADAEALRRHGFSETHLLEAAAIAAIAFFFNTLDTGVGAEPDFHDNIPWKQEAPHPFSLPETPTGASTVDAPGLEDPDAGCLQRVQAGDADAFEELVRRHGRRVQRVLAGILHDPDDVEDAVQDTFLKAFRHIAKFEGRSKFSTWITRVAVNTGLQLIRGRKEFRSLDEHADTLDRFRPRRLQAWQDNPEQSYSKIRNRELIMQALLEMPPKYRLAVMLRDLQQLSTKEAAEAMGLKIPALKARLFRGRLMLREALAPYFERKEP